MIPALVKRVTWSAGRRAWGSVRRIQKLVRSCGSLDSGRSMIHYRATPAMCHSGNIVQGGFITGWMDAAMAYVTMAVTDYEFSPLSLEIKVSFMQSARPGINIAEACAMGTAIGPIISARRP